MALISVETIIENKSEQERKDKDTSKTERSEREKPSKILISHATKDGEYAEALVNLLRRMDGLSTKDIVCSSVAEYGIPTGADIYEWLRNQFVGSRLHVIFLLSSTYYESAACLNEMGAAWITQSICNTILLPGFSVQDMRDKGGCLNTNRVATVLDGTEADIKARLRDIREQVGNQFALNPPSPNENTRWEEGMDEFLQRIQNIKTKEKRM